MLTRRNFINAATTAAVIEGPYEVAFDPAWGGPERSVTFGKLADWKDHPDPGIKYYSGEAVYRKTFDRPTAMKEHDCVFLDLGVVHKLARVKLNGEDLGIVWTPPYRVAVTGKLKPGPNRLEVTVVNTWVNRLIGDQQPGDKDTRVLTWDDGMLGGKPQRAGRYTFTSYPLWKKGDVLAESGLLGPVTIQMAERTTVQ